MAASVVDIDHAVDLRSPASGDTAASTTSIDDLPADVLALVLRRLDGASLAALGSASSAFHALASDPATWRALCLATWPSLHAHDAVDLLHHPRALFADAFPFPAASSSTPSTPTSTCLPTRLVSAVDLHHGDLCIMSRVIETDAASPWFLGSPFRIDALVQEGFTAPPPTSTPTPTTTTSAPPPLMMTPSDLSLSWILIDPRTGRAVNASTRRPVAVDRKWLTGDAVARFTLVLGGGDGGGIALDTCVTCDERYGHVREVTLCVEGADGGGVSGREGLAAVAAAMAGPRRLGEEEEEARRRYGEFVKGKRARKEWKARREGLLDLCCSGVGAAAFVSFLVMLMFR
ncbi:hypothetical protein PR202_gb16378 [Eleusine coracana subsp. coracana]|uniref:F-box domain-containing protein n=1 Tax=Eleusine coracana subsp. coracana TaxID=191504 RepID=A0AAV5F0B9_ELECO|nr:hypothetical protein QOZ80_9BG0698950 [Eleusine coracana subsp. coracana]GJN28272.1 hypothetical protein PR202_gb16378 [Eleusine coracana subsp. coracana]